MKKLLSAVFIILIFCVCVSVITYADEVATEEPVVYNDELANNWTCTEVIHLTPEEANLDYDVIPDSYTKADLDAFEEWFGHSMEDSVANFTTTDKDGNTIPAIMSKTIMQSNPRKLVLTNGLGQQKTQIVSGPNIVVNGFRFPEECFYAFSDGWDIGFGRKQSTVSYKICCKCLAESGVEKESAEHDITPIDFCMSSSSHRNAACEASFAELSLSFTLDHYDEKENTYYFTTDKVNRLYGGVSNVFFKYSNGTSYKMFPQSFGNDVIVREVIYYKGNNYWSYYGFSRNELRRDYFNYFNIDNMSDLPYDSDIQF